MNKFKASKFELAGPPETITRDGKEYQLNPELTVQDSHVYEEVVNVGWCGESGAPTVEVYDYTNYFTKWGQDLRDPLKAVEYRDRIEAELEREQFNHNGTRRSRDHDIDAMRNKNLRLQSEVGRLRNELLIAKGEVVTCQAAVALYREEANKYKEIRNLIK